MSDTSQGEGWWQAADGKWYAPQSAETAPASPPPPAPTGSQPQGEGVQPRETATAALVCGIVGLCLSWIPFVGFVGLVLGVIAVALGFAKRKTHKVAVSIILGTLAIVVSTVVWFVFWAAVEDAVDEVDACLSAIVYDQEQLLETGTDPDTAAEACGNSGGLFGSDVSSYGDDPELDALWDACEAGDDIACLDLYWESPLGSEYESFAQENGGGSGGLFGSGASSYGDDPELDALWDACEAGDDVACDDLYWESPLGSEYESFAQENGGGSGGLFGSDPSEFRSDCASGDVSACVDLFLAASDTDDEQLALDGLRGECAGDDMFACDLLYLYSPFGSDDQEFGATCGGRTDGSTANSCERE